MTGRSIKKLFVAFETRGNVINQGCDVPRRLCRDIGTTFTLGFGSYRRHMIKV
jgi:hypothetical protein